jgi:hypothetical protein
VGPQREGNDRVSPGAGGDGPKPAMDYLIGQCLLQPATGDIRCGTGHAPARTGGWKPANTPQEVVSYDQGNILLAPVNQQTVYVPAYNP